MKQLSKILAIFTMGLLILLSFGCNQETETSKSESEVSSQSETEVANYAGVSIDVLQFWPNEVGDIIDNLGKEFTSRTGAVVNVISSPVASHLNDINIRIQSDNLPEIYTMWPGPSINPYIESNVMADLSNEPWLSRVSEAAKKHISNELDNKTYLAPVNATFMALAYNVSVFERLNLEPPKNYAEFETILETMKNDSEVISPMILGADCLPSYAYFISLSDIYQSIPDFDAQVSGGTKQFNGEEMTGVFRRLLIEWPEKGYYNSETALTTDRMSKAVIDFLDGKAGIMRVGAWDLPIIDDLNDNNTEYKLFPYPAKDNPGSVLMATGEAFAVSALAEGMEKEATLAFLSILMESDNNADLCKALNSLSPLIDVDVPLNPSIAVLQNYLDQPTRGWNIWPMTVQTNLYDIGDVLTASSSTKESVLAEKLKIFNDAWMRG